MSALSSLTTYAAPSTVSTSENTNASTSKKWQDNQVIKQFMAFAATLKEEPEHDPGNLGIIPFVPRTKREENRKAYLFDLAAAKTSEELDEWLKFKGWTQADLDQLNGNQNEEEFVLELINKAIDRDDYELIQSLPNKYQKQIFDQLDMRLSASYHVFIK